MTTENDVTPCEATLDVNGLTVACEGETGPYVWHFHHASIGWEDGGRILHSTEEALANA